MSLAAPHPRDLTDEQWGLIGLFLKANRPALNAFCGSCGPAPHGRTCRTAIFRARRAIDVSRPGSGMESSPCIAIHDKRAASSRRRDAPRRDDQDSKSMTVSVEETTV